MGARKKPSNFMAILFMLPAAEPAAMREAAQGLGLNWGQAAARQDMPPRNGCL
jgi:hypothetical protein